MNADRLRDALRAEVADVHASADAFDRLERRLATPTRSDPRSRVLVGIAVVLAAALVGAVLLAIREPASRHEPAGPLPAGMPRRIAAVTTDGRLVLLDSRDGRILRTLAHDVAVFRGTPELAASPDGSSVYFTSVDRTTHTPPGCETAGQETVYSVTVDGSRNDVIARGRTVAVSLQGRVASSQDHQLCATGPGSLRISRQGAPRWVGPGPGDPELVLFDLRWTDDGGTLTFNSAGAGTTTSQPRGGEQPYALTVATARTASDARCVCATSGAAVYGSFGTSPGFLGTVPSGTTPRYAEDAVVLRDDGSVERRLFHWNADIGSLHSDRRGDLAMISPAADNGRSSVDALYRWSPGDRQPVKLRDGIVAAAWVPDPAPTVQPAMARYDTDGRLSLLDADGNVTRSLGRLPGVSTIVATPDGRSLLADVHSDPVDCAGKQPPEVVLIDRATGARTKIAAGRFPAVSGSGLVAYEQVCDGVRLGFVDLVNEPARPNAMVDGPNRITDPVAGIRPVAWSPDGDALLYLVERPPAPSQFSVGRLTPVVLRPRQTITPLADLGTWTAADFLDDTHLAVLVPAAGRTEVREVRIPDVGESVPESRRRFEVDGQATRIWVDPTSRTVYVARPGRGTGDGDLLRWRPGETAPRPIARGWGIVPLVG